MLLMGFQCLAELGQRFGHFNFGYQGCTTSQGSFEALTNPIGVQVHLPHLPSTANIHSEGIANLGTFVFKRNGRGTRMILSNGHTSQAEKMHDNYYIQFHII